MSSRKSVAGKNPEEKPKEAALKPDKQSNPAVGKEKNTMKMSLEEKIAMIDREISAIHHCFVRQGFTPLEIEHGARPILACIASAYRKRWAIGLVKFALVIAVIWAVLYFKPASGLMVFYSRIAAVKLLYPYWDFTTIHRDYECSVKNPYYVPPKLGVDDCEKCENLDFISRLSNLSSEVMNEQYLRRDTPVIVTDAMSQWPAMKKFDIQELARLYTSEPKLKDVNGCYFSSNIRSGNGNNRLFLMRAADGEFNDFYAHWENCLDDSAKALRNYYHRPYFLPRSSFLDANNWVFLSSEYNSRIFKMNPLTGVAPMIWYAQIRGRTEIRLLPRSPCDSKDLCINLVDTLNEGEILVFTDAMWNFDFVPGGGSPSESVAIGGGGTFD
ncbi:uncharacterized protein LOC141903714 [Tubulanus polymorphus]|uniref:uncharacterized protein LOC141903714 n=1 Tax=Tubulanus polymorphus TaxID=672921 RepID=UPI003DA3FA21